MGRPRAVPLYLLAALLPVPFILRDLSAEGSGAAVVLGAMVGLIVIGLPLAGLWFGSRVAWFVLAVIEALGVVIGTADGDQAYVVLSLLRFALLISPPVRAWVFDVRPAPSDPGRRAST